MEKETLIVVGLGNPGTQYAHTRHNAGFDTLEMLCRKWGVTLNKSKCKGLLTETNVDGKRVVCAADVHEPLRRVRQRTAQLV